MNGWMDENLPFAFIANSVQLDPQLRFSSVWSLCTQPHLCSFVLFPGCLVSFPCSNQVAVCGLAKINCFIQDLFQPHAQNSQRYITESEQSMSERMNGSTTDEHNYFSQIFSLSSCEQTQSLYLQRYYLIFLYLYYIKFTHVDLTANTPSVQWRAGHTEQHAQLRHVGARSTLQLQ